MTASLGRNYSKLWAAGTISNLGDGAGLTAVPLLAAALTRDPAVFAGVTVASRLPWLLFALPAGALIDKCDRRLLIGRVDLLRFGVVGLLAASVHGDWISIPLLYALSFLLGIGEVVADIAAQVLMPSLVDASLLERANGRLFAAEITTNQFIGPPLGGWLFALATPAPFFLDAATFLLAGALVLAIRGSFRPAPAVRAADEERRVGRLGEGISWLWQHRLLRALALLGSAMNALWTAGLAILGLHALEVLGLSEVGYGVLLTGSGVGYVAGSVAAERAITALGRARSLAAATVAEIGLFLALGLTSSAVAAGIGLAVFGFFSALWDVTAVSLRQAVVPDHLFGRVNSAYRFLQWGSMPAGALLGAMVAGLFGLRAPWLVGAGLLGISLAAALGHLKAAERGVSAPR